MFRWMKPWRLSHLISAAGHLVYDAGEMAPLIGDYDSELTEEFLRAFQRACGDTPACESALRQEFAS